MNIDSIPSWSRACAAIACAWATANIVPDAAAQSAYIPAKGEWVATTAYSFFRFDEFWFGNEKGELPSAIQQHNFALVLEYGLTDAVALDATVGWAFNHFDAQSDNDGITDTLIGIRWQLWDEFEHPESAMPTLALRVGAIIEGTYDALTDGSFNSIGDSASGVEGSILFGRAFGNSGFGIYGDGGYRWRSESVPQDIFGSAGIYKTFAQRWNVRAGYRFTYGFSGVDIFSEEFDFGRFPESQEILHNVEAGIGYTFGNGVYLQVFGAKTVDGKNTGDKTFVGISASFPFGGASDEVPLPYTPKSK